MDQAKEEGWDVDTLADALENHYVEEAIEAESSLSGVIRELLSVALNFVDWRSVATDLMAE